MSDDAVGNTEPAPARPRGLRPPWKPGESGNPKGRPSHRAIFEEALGRAVTENADKIVAALVRRAVDGNARMMTALLDRLVAKITRHEFDGDASPAKMVIEFAKATEAKEEEHGDDE